VSKPAKQKDLTDSEVIHLITKEGKLDQFELLYDRYANKVYRKCILMVNDLVIAQDLSQDIMIKAFLNISKFEGRSSFSTWVYNITYNYCVDFLRKKKRNRVNELDEKFLNKEDNSKELEEKEVIELEIERLKELLPKLQDMDRAILIMRYLEEKPVKEIMTIIDQGESATKMRLKRARDRMRKLYEQTYPNLNP